MPEIQATVVFEKNWNAIHEKNPDGTRKWRYIINEGSSRSSKTRSIIQMFYLYAHQNKGKRLSVWRDTKKDCRDTVGNDVKEVFPGLPFAHTVSFNKTEAIYSFPTGSVFEINGNDEPNKLHGYNGHAVWINEPYRFTKDAFDQLDMRTEDFLVIDWNPQMMHFIDTLKKDPRCLVIHSTFKDNPFCPPEQKAKILSYQPVKLSEIVISKQFTEEEARKYDILTNPKQITDKQIRELSRCIENERKGTANPFNWMVYGLGLKAEKPNRIFSWQEIPDEEYHTLQAKKYYACDWGIVDPWAILEGKYYDGGLYLHELNYKSENLLRETLTPDQLSKINTDDEGLVSWHFTNLKIDRKSDIICDTNRPLKITALWNSGYDYATTAPKVPGSIEDGINLLSSLKVYYTKSSVNIALEQEIYEREVDRYGVVLEVPVDKDNHLMDCSRMLALWLRLQGIIKSA